MRSALPLETDPTNQAVLIETLGNLNDAVSLPLFVEILQNADRAEAVRMAALVALTAFATRSPCARLALLYAEKTPPALVALPCPTWLVSDSFRPTISARSWKTRLQRSGLPGC